MQRRRFVGVAGGAALASGCAIKPGATATTSPAARVEVDDWQKVRAAFDQDPEYLNFTGFLLMPHAKPVRDAIAAYRARLDRNPVLVLEEQLERAKAGESNLNTAPRVAAAEFLSAKPEQFALTDSTTMGLGLVYTGFRISSEQEIVVSAHGHYSTFEALRLRSEREGTKVRVADFYADPARVSVDEVVAKLLASLTPKTRLVALTWVHSSTGVKMPIRVMADALVQVNAERGAEDRVFLSVDGVHGFGVENVSMADLGCDIFIAGCHKWLCGPRGTGIVWANDAAWEQIVPTIAAFEGPPFLAWLRGEAPSAPGGILNTPGGFHSFEHRWALPEGFAFQTQIGRARIEARVHALNSRLKQGLSEMSRVRLHTPLAPELSCGINCFEVDGKSPEEVEAALLKKRVIASVSPYKNAFARLSAGLLNDEEQVDRALEAVAAL